MKRTWPSKAIQKCVVLKKNEGFSAGRKIFLRHIRDGKELASIASDENFDFSYQEARLFNPPRTVLPVKTRSLKIFRNH
jgi:hypothetical protein